MGDEEPDRGLLRVGRLVEDGLAGGEDLLGEAELVLVGGAVRPRVLAEVRREAPQRVDRPPHGPGPVVLVEQLVADHLAGLDEGLGLVGGGGHHLHEPVEDGGVEELELGLLHVADVLQGPADPDRAAVVVQHVATQSPQPDDRAVVTAYPGVEGEVGAGALGLAHRAQDGRPVGVDEPLPEVAGLDGPQVGVEPEQAVHLPGDRELGRVQVEVVAAESRDGLRLVELAPAARQLVHQLAALTVVGDPVHVDGLAVLAAQLALADHQRDEGAVLADVGALDVDAVGAVPPQLLEVREELPAPLLVVGVRARHRLQLRDRVAQQLGHPRVDGDRAAGAVEHPDAITGGLDEPPEEGVRAEHDVSPRCRNQGAGET